MSEPFKSMTLRDLLNAMVQVMQAYDAAPEDIRNDIINPDAPVLIDTGIAFYEIRSVGGDPDEEGLILETQRWSISNG